MQHFEGPGGYAAATRRFAQEQAQGWAALPFFQDGTAMHLAGVLDAEVAAGQRVLPGPGQTYRALALTPPEATRVVLLGQDPYPTPGDAEGLAFSVAPGQPLPRSLRNIGLELAADGFAPPLASGSLVGWARQGVLLLNTALSVRAGEAGSHRALGWGRLTREVLGVLSGGERPMAFLLWGNDAQAQFQAVSGGQVAARHLVLASAHPSPLAARRGFFGSRPFSRVNDWLAARGEPPVQWSLE